MITKLFTIYDSKAQTYNRPFHQLNDEVAKRTASDLRTTNDDIASNPEDYSLFELGTYDDSTANMDLHDSPLHFISFHEIKPKLGKLL